VGRDVEAPHHHVGAVATEQVAREFDGGAGFVEGHALDEQERRAAGDLEELGGASVGAHWTPEGHKLVAERVLGLLSENNIVKAEFSTPR